MERKIVNNNNKNKKTKTSQSYQDAHTHKSYISSSSDTQNQKPEHCLNPWNPDCKNTDIALDIEVNEKRRPICRSCWEAIAGSNREWGPAC
jgi:hypothetical protein